MPVAHHSAIVGCEIQKARSCRRADMTNRLGPLEVNCDAPPYNIVRACHMIGIRSAEDVRWCRLGQYVNTLAGWRDAFKHQSWKVLLGMAQPENITCHCRQKLPVLEKYTFTLISGNQTSYFIGQCSRCLAVYWEEGQSEA
jgi:hypothetical protein